MKPFIPTIFYGVLNYIISFTLIASPWLFDLIHVSSAAWLIPVFIGWIQFIMAVFVDNETGFVKKFPMQINLAIDVVMGFLLMVSPWLYTFSSKAFLPQLLIGGLLIFLGSLTKNSPFTTPAHRAANEGQLMGRDAFEGRLNI
jgi:hypothetical protein